MTIGASSTNTSPDGLLIGWTGSFDVQMTGGTLTTGTSTGDGSGTFGLTVSESGTGTFTQTGGLVTAPLVNLGRVTGGNGTYTLSGGTLSTSRIAKGIGGGTLNLNGGTIRVSGTSSALIGSTVTTVVQAGRAIIDTNNFDATIASAISGTGGFTKNGSGTLVLSNDTVGYTGTTVVNAGVLQIGTNNAVTTLPTGSYSIAAGAKLVLSRNANVTFQYPSFSGAGDVEFQGNAGGYYSFKNASPLYAGTLSYTGQTIVNMSSSLATAGNAWKGSLWLEKDNVLPNASVVNLQSGKIWTRSQTGTGISVAGITGSAGTFITTDASGGTQKWTVTVASGSSFTYAGVIGWDGQSYVTSANGNNLSFTKAGEGTQIFSGVNTYTGTTTISGGTLQIGDGGTTGSIVSDVAVSAGATLAFRRSNALTYSGTVSGAGGLSQLGSGTLTLNGSNSYAGPTVIAGGVLQAGGTGALSSGTITFSGGTLQYTGAAAGTDWATRIRSSDSAIALDTNGQNVTLAGTIDSTNNGGLTKIGSGSLTLSGTNTYAGKTTVNAGMLQFVTPTSLYGGTTANWTAANIVTGSGATVAVSVGASNFTADNVTTLLANLGGLGGTVNNNGLQAGSAIGFDTSNAGGTFIITDSIQNSTGTGGGAFNVVKLGSGTLALAGVNTFSGATRIAAGGLSIGNALALQNSTLDMNASDTGTIASIDQNSTLGGLTGSRNIDMGGRTLSIGNNNASTTYSGTLSNGGLTKVGTGTLILSALNAYTGLTTISGGTLQIGNNTSTPIPALGGYSLANGATLVFSTNYASNPSGTATISGTGNVVFAGMSSAGTYYTTANIAANGLTYTGTTTVDLSNSTSSLYIEAAAGKTLPSSTILNLLRGNVYLRQGQTVAGLTGTGGAIAASVNASTLTINVAPGISYSSAAALNTNDKVLSLTKSGSGTQILTGSSSFTGLTTITGGRLEIGSTGQIGSGTVTINGSSADFRYNSATPLARSITFTQGTISGTGTIGTAVSVGANNILSPGNSPGIQAYTQGLTFAQGGQYTWEINDTASTAGTGWDLINVSGGSGLAINATSGTTFKIAITSLSGTAAGNAANFSATKAGSWTILLSSNGITGFSADKFALDRSAFSNSTSGSFTISQAGSGSNQSLVIAYNTISAITSSTGALTGFRVMQNQATTTSVNLLGGGPDSTDYLLSPSAALSLTSSSTGTLAGSGTQAISFGYASTAATGARSGTVSFTNTGNTNDAVGTIAVSGAVVDNRVVTTSAVNFGLVHVGGSGTATSSFTSAGSDTNFTRITVANGSGGGLTVSGSSGFVFDGTGGSSRTIAGSFGTVGAISGTITLTNSSAETGGLLPGQVPGTTAVAYSASVFSGTGTWNVAGGGSWGTGASSDWTSAGDVGAAPGTFAGYGTTDRAIFAGGQSGTSTILLNGATPSLAALVFSNTANRYVIDQGSGGSLTLATTSGKPSIEVALGGLHEIKAGMLGNSGLEKRGAGTLVLSGSNGYTGATDVTAGTLAINGSLGGAVNVASGAILGGTGALDGLVTVTAGGILAPGNSPGTLTMNAGLVLADASVLNFELSATDFTVGGGINDLINVNGPFTLDGVLNVTGLGDFSTVADNTKWRLFNYDVGGTFTNNGLSLGTMPSVGASGKYFQIDTATAGQVNLVIVPEPSAAAIAVAGLTGAYALLRRRRRATV